MLQYRKQACRYGGR
uniref:Uncharacterized protein n=1 Tax=Arundo donax TaxID=35708 RepID=A0A0A9CHL0_ARUDO